jgi:hypothetical protein
MPGEFECDVSLLKFDTENPRFAGRTFANENEIIQCLYDEMDVDEVIRSILSSGYLNFEPLIVKKEGTNFIVLEGNRRLAALRLINDAALCKKLKIALPTIPHAKAVPAKVRVWEVDNRNEARAFIGFKHINGPFRWDAYAKAQYAAKWLQDGADIDVISRTLGDTHNTVRRLVNGYFALDQAKAAGFDQTKTTNKRFAFSHLYTALTRGGYRDYLGLPEEDVSKPPKREPIPKENLKELSTVMTWLYGQGDSKALIQSQNPDLNKLNEVLSHKEAKKMLLAKHDLNAAYERVEPPSHRFEDALLLASRQCEEAMKMSGHYDGDRTLLEVAENMQRTTKSLLVVMKDKLVEKDRS